MATSNDTEDSKITELKDNQRRTWASAAEGWHRRDALLRKGAEPVTRRMLELVELVAGNRLLDIASGTGEPAISAAKIVGDAGKVIGTDLVDEMLVIARDKANSEGLSNIEFRCIDAEQLDVPGDYFNAVTIRWGLMFMPQPLACLTTANQSLSPGGRISLACWTTPENNPFISILMQVLKKYMDVPVPPPGTPGIFSFADSNRLHDVLVSAGFNNITLEEMKVNVIEVADGRAYWEAMSDLAAPVMVLVNQLDPSARAAYIDEVIAMADNLKQGDTLCIGGSTWIACASKA